MPATSSTPADGPARGTVTKPAKLAFRPRLTGRKPAGAVLVLHGGRETSTAPVRPMNLAALRMRPFAGAILRRDADLPIVVGRLSYRVRGWNGAAEDPVVDARWALGEIQREFGSLPVLLVGHSLGGRTALRVAGHEAVFAVAALAPWLPPGEPVEQLRGRNLLIAHAPDDRVTDPAASRAYARRAESVAEHVEYRLMPRGRHSMLRGAGEWHRLVADFVATQFGDVSARRVPAGE